MNLDTTASTHSGQQLRLYGYIITKLTKKIDVRFAPRTQTNNISTDHQLPSSR